MSDYKPLVGPKPPYTNTLGQQITPGATTIPGVGPIPLHPAAQKSLVPAHLSGSTGPQIANMPVRLRQQYLRSLGYDVGVDGLDGPQTRTATNAFLKGTPARVWNHAWMNSHTTAPASTAADTTTDVRTTTTAGTNSGGAGGGGGGGGGGVVNPLAALLQTYLDKLGSFHQPTAEEIAKAAAAQAQSALAPQIVTNQNAQAQAQAEAVIARQQAQQDAQRAATFETNKSAALANLLRGIAPQVENVYQQAGDSQAAYAKGLSGDLARTAATDAAKTNTFLDSIGSPTGQHINPSSAGANVVYGLGGLLPGQQMAREGAAFTSAAKLLPGTAIGRGQQGAADALHQGLDEQQKIRADLALNQQQLRGDLSALQSQRPGLIQTATNNLQSQATQDAGLAQNAALAPLLIADKFENFPGVNPVTGMPTSTQTNIDVASAKLDNARRVIAQGDRKLNLDEKKAAWQAAKDAIKISQSQKPKRLSPKDRATYTGTAYTIAHTGHDGYTDKDGNDHPPLLYVDAVKAMQNAGVPWMIAKRILNNTYKPGELGRPGIVVQSKGPLGAQGYAAT